MKPLRDLGVWIVLAVACSQAPKPPELSREAEEQKRTADPKDREPAKGPLRVEGLEWGAYPITDLPRGSRGVAWESGYINMRQIKGSDSADIYDYRWYLSAVASGDDTLPTASTSGCKSWPKETSLTTNAFVEMARFEGAFSTSVRGPGILNVSTNEKDDDFEFVPSDELRAVLSTARTQYEVTAPTPPSAHNLQFFGAFAGSLNVNTVLSVVNSNLRAESADLILADMGEGDAYNTAVVVLFPGTNAASAKVRCVVAAGDRISIPPSEYQTWLPLKGFIVFAAETALETSDDGTDIWKSSIRGDGVEDLSVP